MKAVLSNDLFKENEFIQMLNNNGIIIDINNFVNIDNAKLIAAFKIMNLSRIYEQKAFQFQKHGTMLTFPPAMGQEAIQVAIAMNMRPKYDWFVSSYRNNATWLYLNRSLKQIFQYWCGNEKGNSLAKEYRILPVNVLIGTQFSHATGVALANKIRKEDCLTITTIGDGGTSSGEFYAAMNFAATLKLGVIFIIENNQWAISTPLSVQTAAITLSQKAVAAGLKFYRVDGNDLFACNAVMQAAVKDVNSGIAPVLIEALTYRIGSHTTADDPTLYRSEAYHKEQLKNDPLVRIKKYLIDKKIWTEAQQKELDNEQVEEVMRQYQAALDDNTVELWEVFKDTYKQLDQSLMNQYQELQDFYQKTVDKKVINNYEHN